MFTQIGFRLETQGPTADRPVPLDEGTASVRLDSFGHELAVALRFAYDTDGAHLEITPETRTVSGQFFQRHVTLRASRPLSETQWLSVLRRSLAHSHLDACESGVVFR
jgi:hypothetical protein